METFCIGAFPALPDQNILPVCGYVYSTQHMQMARLSKWERSPTAKSVTVPKQNVHSDSAMHCTLP